MENNRVGSINSNRVIRDPPKIDAETSMFTWVSPEVGRLSYIDAEARFEISADLNPVSSQSPGGVKSGFRAALRSLTTQFPYLCTSDVSVDIQWSSTIEDRYETDSSCDIDNIIKPIMDAISGPEGLLVNDCQLQSVSSFWMDYCGQEALHITVKCQEPFFVSKGGAIFVEAMPRLYYPMDDQSPMGSRISTIRMLERLVKIRSDAGEAGEIYREYCYYMPCQRFFHRTRVGDFKRRTLSQYREDCGMPMDDR